MLMLVVKRLLGAAMLAVSGLAFANFVGLSNVEIFEGLRRLILFLVELALLIIWSGAILWLLFSERE